MHNFLLTTVATALFAATSLAQTSIWTPPGYASMFGNSNNSYPWHRGTAPMRYQQMYSGSDFTLQGAAFPLLISRLRFRCYQQATTWPGGSWPNIVLNMSTAATTYLTASTTFASNHGTNLTNVYTGPITVQGGTNTGIPGPVFIDITLQTPFLYDPTAGDLCFEVLVDGIGWTGTSTFVDAVSATGPGGPALGTRIYNTTSHTAATGTVGLNYALITEFTYLPATGYAYSIPYGTGCYDRAQSSFYQLFQNGTFNLNNSSIQMVAGSTGYVVIPGNNTWWTPVGAAIPLTDDSVSSPLALPFTFNYPGGSTMNLHVSSNGFVWMQPNTNNGCCAGVPTDLLGMGARFCPLWNDLNPGAGGSVVFDVDAVNQVAYVTFTNVPEFATTNLNTFQIAFHASGNVDMRWQTCSVLSHVTLTGWSPGGGQRDPGSVTISTALPIVTRPDLIPLQLGASARPTIGTSINLVTSNIPAGTVIGAIILSNTQHNPGLDLGTIGMPGCRQYVGLDVTNIFLVTGASANSPLGIPNVPSLVGVRAQSQSAVFAIGLNPLGVTSSNGLTLVVDQF